MESLHLPPDLYWDVKMEPYSPIGEFSTFINADDSWLLEDNFAKDESYLIEKKESDCLPLIEDDEVLYEIEFDVNSEENDTKINSDQWMNGKENFYDMADCPENLLSPQYYPPQITKVQNPIEIIMELEKIYNIPEFIQLTPQQIPTDELNKEKEVLEFATQNSYPFVTDLNYNGINSTINNDTIVMPLNDNIDHNIIPALSPCNSDYSSTDISSPSSADIAREMEIVDEILRTRANELSDLADEVEYDDNESQHSTSSAVSSEFSSKSSSTSIDDEWSQKSSDTSLKISKMNIGKTHEKSLKKRTRPYGRPVEEKKVRKKEQNKNAATRYRQKKKQEMEEILDEERILLNHNEELLKKYADMEREVKYLKQLIREFYKSKSISK